MDKIFFLSHRTSLALKNSEEFLNDKSLFGSQKSDRNLNEEGNLVLGGGDDDSDDEDVVFHNEAPPSEDKSNDEDSIDKNSQTQMEVTPNNSVMSFWRQVIWHWTTPKKTH